jgi:hypothetical protein
VRARPPRCSNLQELHVDWEDEEGCSSNVHFKGAGSTTQEQRASMQRQLEALRSSTAFMAPESWPACSCLTAIAVDSVRELTDDVYLSAAAHTPSLARLHINTYQSTICTTLGSSSSLQQLTSLNLSSPEKEPGPLGDEVLAAIGQLSSLRQLDVGAMLLPNYDLGHVLIPGSWSALSSLTHLGFADCDRLSIVVTPLTSLVALESLQMPEAVALGRLKTLFGLTRLTRLDGPYKFYESDGDDTDDDDGADIASRGRVPEVPQQWRDGLQHLHWRNYDRNSCAMLSQLTSLTYLCLDHVLITPDVCR